MLKASLKNTSTVGLIENITLYVNNKINNKCMSRKTISTLFVLIDKLILFEVGNIRL